MSLFLDFKMKNILPNFFIVGAAKAGTTSLYNYLEQHPDIFLPKNKEPKYFVNEFLNLPQNGNGDKLTYDLMIKSFNEYVDLFDKKKPNQICGEASVDYLYYSEKVIPLIKEKIQDPKIIIMLRDPISRAFSAYKHLIRDVRETESFERGLELENERINNNYEFIWHYKQASLYYDDVKNYLHSFNNVKIIIFEEFVKDPQRTMKDVLEVEDNFVAQVGEKYNFTGKPKNKGLQKLLKGSPNNPLRKIFKFLINENLRLKIRNKLEKFNISQEKIKLLPETKNNLSTIFEDDRLKLEKLIKKKLNYWI